MLWDTFGKVSLALCKLTRGPSELNAIYWKCVLMAITWARDMATEPLEKKAELYLGPLNSCYCHTESNCRIRMVVMGQWQPLSSPQLPVGGEYWSSLPRGELRVWHLQVWSLQVWRVLACCSNPQAVFALSSTSVDPSGTVRDCAVTGGGSGLTAASLVGDSVVQGLGWGIREQMNRSWLPGLSSACSMTQEIDFHCLGFLWILLS